MGEGGRGGGAVGGRFCMGSLVPLLCVPEGANNRNIAKTISPRPLFCGRGLVFFLYFIRYSKLNLF